MFILYMCMHAYSHDGSWCAYILLCEWRVAGCCSDLQCVAVWCRGIRTDSSEDSWFSYRYSYVDIHVGIHIIYMRAYSRLESERRSIFEYIIYDMYVLIHMIHAYSCGTRVWCAYARLESTRRSRAVCIPFWFSYGIHVYIYLCLRWTQLLFWYSYYVYVDTKM